MFAKSSEKFAVFANQLYYSYSKTEPILNGINVRVNQGIIYALVGLKWLWEKVGIMVKCALIY